MYVNEDVNIFEAITTQIMSGKNNINNIIYLFLLRKMFFIGDVLFIVTPVNQHGLLKKLMLNKFMYP